jgi:hypothetical protein
MALWHDQSLIYGVRTKAYFFDGNAIQQEPDLPTRALPLLRNVRLKTLFTEKDRKNFFHGEIAAQPDAVFEYGAGLISVEYKYAGGKPHHRDAWQRQIRLKDMLQCVIAGYAVAQNYKRVTACVLRYHNVCYLLTPEAAVFRSIFELIPLAKQYFEQSNHVAASKLAQFSTQRIQDRFQGPEDARSEEGRVAHDRMLKR